MHTQFLSDGNFEVYTSEVNLSDSYKKLYTGLVWEKDTNRSVVMDKPLDAS